MQRLGALVRRSGTILTLLGLAAAATAALLADSLLAGVAIVLVVAAIVQIVHHDQIVRRNYRLAAQLDDLDRRTTQLCSQHEVLSTRHDHLGSLLGQLLGQQDRLLTRHAALHSVDDDARIELAAIRRNDEGTTDALNDLAGLPVQATEIAGALARLGGELDERLAKIERDASDRTGELYRRLNSAHWHRERLYRQIEALRNLSSMYDGLPGLPPLRGWALSPDVLVVLFRLVIETQPQLVVELGSGSSTALLTRMLDDHGGGRVVSIEHDRDYVAESRSILIATGIPDRADIVLCPLTEIDVEGSPCKWYDIAQLELPGPIDLLLIDGPPQDTGPLARLPAQRLFDRVRDGGLIVLDDADRPDERATVEIWCARPDVELLRRPDTEKGTAILRKISPTANPTG